VVGLATSPVRHLVWDWNGTIFDDTHAVVDAVNQVCADFGREPIDAAYWRSIYRRPLLECYTELLGRGLSAADWARVDRRYHDAYRALLPHCGLAPGVPAELARWQRSGRSQSLLSMWFHHELLPLVTEYGLTDYFSRVDGLRVEVGGESKSQHLAEHLAAQGLAAADVLLIGDVADDALAAAHAGARCVLVTTGVSDRERLADAGVPVVDSIAEALDLTR
jgi:phosphoglycolate phosphatase-like HAD superfamily hydrolase